MGKERPSSREREVPGGKSRYRPPGGEEAVEVWSRAANHSILCITTNFTFEVTDLQPVECLKIFIFRITHRLQTSDINCFTMKKFNLNCVRREGFEPAGLPKRVEEV